MIEHAFGLPSTYNRSNAVKFSLIAGKRRIRDVQAACSELVGILHRRLELSVNESGWLWADLGDCRALLGDIDGAAKAYSTFLRMADRRSQAKPLEVLRSIFERLEQAGDSEAQSLKAVINGLEERLQH